MIERGHIRRQRGDFEAAVGAFAAAADADPNNRNIQVELSRALRSLDRLDEAEAVVSRILDVEPDQVGALIERGHLLRRRGDRDRCCRRVQGRIS